MIKFDITDSFFYRWRYTIGYSLVGLILIAMLIFVGFYLPGGISNQEMKSVVASSNTNFWDPLGGNIIDLPYHLLQHLSLAIFGVSIIGIKLPSLIISFAAVIGMVLLVKQWFKSRIGILASLIAITTGQFLFIAQSGTPDVLLMLWPVWLILLASLITIEDKFRPFLVVALSALSALSLYTPLSIYVLIAFVLAVIIHPHLRCTFKRIPRAELIAGLLAALLIVAPLVGAIIKTPSLLSALLGMPAHLPNIVVNLSALGKQYFDFAGNGSSYLITPYFGLGSILLIAIGAYYNYQTRSTAKSYTIAIWSIFLLLIIVFNPYYVNAIFLPMLLLLAAGLDWLLKHWYGMFPRNPYARIGGLIPIVILVSALIFTGMNRYIYSYKYDPVIVPSFSKDITLLPVETSRLVVARSEFDFYRVVAKYNKKLIVTTSPAGNSFLATRAAKNNFKGYNIVRIITSANSNESDRFYLYQKTKI